MTTENIAELQITVSHHERQIQDLSDMISQQWKEIERLKLLLDRAQEKISEIESSSGTKNGDAVSVADIAAAEKPPHY